MCLIFAQHSIIFGILQNTVADLDHFDPDPDPVSDFIRIRIQSGSGSGSYQNFPGRVSRAGKFVI